LLKTDTHKYLYLTGYEFFSFETNDDITEFYAPIGNSDVPYPFAIGEKNAYILCFRKCVDKSHIDTLLDPVPEFLEKEAIATGRKYLQEQWNLESQHKPYDKNVEKDDDVKAEKYGTITFKESPEILQYKMDKYHVTEANIGEYKMFKDMEVTELYHRH
jgi:hypothetical protein